MPGALTRVRWSRTASASPSVPRPSFEADTADREVLLGELEQVCEEVWRRLVRHKFRGRTVVLKLKFDDFRQITRSRTLSRPVDSHDGLCLVAGELLAGVDFGGHRIRLIGVTVGNVPDFAEGCVQLRFDFGEE